MKVIQNIIERVAAALLGCFPAVSVMTTSRAPNLTTAMFFSVVSSFPMSFKTRPYVDELQRYTTRFRKTILRRVGLSSDIIDDLCFPQNNVVQPLLEQECRAICSEF